MRLPLTRIVLIALLLTGCARLETQNRALSSPAVDGGIRIANATGASPAGTSGRNPTIIQGILDNRCSKCHGAGSSAYGGINYITDLNQIIARRKVIPGDPVASPIFQMACGKGPCGPAIPDNEIQEISDWIGGLTVNLGPRKKHSQN